jgi:hypothetical protein
LDAVTPEEFSELLAVEAIDGSGFDRLYELLSRGFAAVCSAFSGEAVDPVLFTPWAKTTTPEPVMLSPQQASAAFKAWAGRQSR